MLLLLTMMMLQVLSAQGGTIQKHFPLVTIGAREDRHIQPANRPRMTKNMYFTFDPATVMALHEYIWVDQE